MTWVPLHVHSQYSLLDASASISGILKKAVDFSLPAVALTDHGNLFGAVEFYKKAQGLGVKPIIGCELYVAPSSRKEKARLPGKRVAYHVTLLAKNSKGYHNLCKLSSKGYLEGFYYYPRVDRELLEEYSEGLICLSGCMSSRLSQAALSGNEESIYEELSWHQKVYGEDFYLEVQRQEMSEEHLKQEGILDETWLEQAYTDFVTKQKSLNEEIFSLAKEKSLPVVATNDSHYLEREDWKAHEILLNIQSGEPCEIWEKDALGAPKFRVPNPKRRVYPSHEFFFKSPEEMQEIFKDHPEALTTTLEVAEKCSLEMDFKSKHYPVFIPPHLEEKDYSEKERVGEVEKFLWDLCKKNIPKRYPQEALDKVKEKYPDKDPVQVVHDRLELEMSIIAPKGMCDYLLIVWDFIHWAKQRGIPVGPGRGSGAGSIVLYLIGITDIEPLRFHLFFERFINPERFSYPDIDVDICMEKRSEVIGYTLEKYGADNVAQIITFGTMKAKMVVKDVGRVLNVPLSKVNKIASLIPEDLNMTLDRALEVDPELLSWSQEDEDVGRILKMGKILEGSVRNTGIHAAGVIICGDPLTNYIPLCLSKDAEIAATQYSMKYVEAVGMLKVDFLGLKTLTSIAKAVELVEKTSGVKLNWSALPLEDQQTFSLLNQGKTLGVFQMESGGMQDLAVHLHIDNFEEIIAVVSLYRPGPMDMIPSFINRKHGREEIEYDHPWMEEILSETYGVMVYQEQVMQIAQKLANYSLGEGDVLRRAMGKKDAEQMDLQREKFREGAGKNDISEGVSEAIFDKMAKFASYGFNKSHAAAYGYLAYATAFLKANYPKEWMSALMTCDRDDISKVSKYIGECQKMGILVLPPDVNESGREFMPTPSGIRFAMSGIKGVGEGVVEAIIEEREKDGSFKDLFDFFSRVDPKKVGKKAVECLILAGGFDYTSWSRDALVESVEPMHQEAVRKRKEQASGVMSLFSLLGEEADQGFHKPPKVRNPIVKRELLLKEKELLGFFLTGHPMEEFKSQLQRLSCISFDQIAELPSSSVFRVAFIVDQVKVRISQRTQKKFAILQVSDGRKRFELPIWPDIFEGSHEILQENRLLYAVLSIEEQGENPKISCKWVDDLTRVNEGMIQACDEAFDRAKQRLAFQEKRRQQGGKKKEVQKDQEDNSQTRIKIDLEKVRLSNIVNLKKILRKYPGSSPVQVSLVYQGASLGELFLDQTKGLNLKDACKKEIAALSAISV